MRNLYRENVWVRVGINITFVFLILFFILKNAGYNWTFIVEIAIYWNLFGFVSSLAELKLSKHAFLISFILGILMLIISIPIFNFRFIEALMFCSWNIFPWAELLPKQKFN
jgi:multisubunit Na+/H+ antiporter MnhF subunit